MVGQRLFRCRSTFHNPEEHAQSLPLCVVLRAIMDISAHATLLADRLQRAVRVTSVRMRREDRSPSSSHPLADLGRIRAVGYVIDSSPCFVLFLCSCLATVPSSRPAGCRRAARRGSQGWPSCESCRSLPCCQATPCTARSTARGSRWMGHHRIALIAREGAPLVENRPRDAGELVGQRNGEHVVV